MMTKPPLYVCYFFCSIWYKVKAWELEIIWLHDDQIDNAIDLILALD